MHDPYELRDDILVAPGVVHHRDEEYPSEYFDILSRIQADHFWYRGRHRFLLRAVRDQLAAAAIPYSRAVDLGGGCGGWVDFLRRHGTGLLPFTELALGDSSNIALRRARETLGMRTALFNVDLLNMQWSERWDMIFLLDVLEHIPDDVRVLKEIWTALTPRGLVFITVPALKAFWTWNDTLAGHRRRYSVKDFHRLALQAQFEVVDARYFMFILSPVLVVARLLTSGLSEHLKKAQMERMHAVPPRLLNKTLEMVFSMEARLGHRVRFPWGTSLLVILRKN